jgi:peptidyl-prolyl cis-trans isomerase C
MSCSIKTSLAGQRTKASVNGVVVPHDLISREVQNHPAKSPIAGWTEAARALAVRELLLQEARRLGVAAEPATDEDGRRETDEEAMIRALVAREVATPEPDADTCRRYYEQNRRRFRSPDIFEAAHILIAAPRQDAPRFEAARRKAREILAELSRAPEHFAELARARSDCPSRESGGNLGQITPGSTVPEFEAALQKLATGAIASEPVESRFGCHVVRLERRIEGRELPFELVAQRIADYLRDRVQRTATAQYLQVLAGKADVQGVELTRAASPLVQ